MILTLPSNSSEMYYPNNTLTEFRTHLVQLLNLEVPYEVALSEITLPTQWECLQTKQQVVIIALRSVYSLVEIKAQKQWLNRVSEDLFPEPISDVDWLPVINSNSAIPYKEDEYDGGRLLTDQDENDIIYDDNNF